ncbi:hypothetical protein J3Q64DRAFT_1748161 [Phycomyces blakesleeanus]|uniref:peptidylprolyl isomerase n=2 Tax=Phycomyces blakesleeanus TaxID=4837 RepID=A0A167MRS7_PHYB8|nr:hypothetical protein PHYBLDRAFT_77798 [Phycomyces blakesleeanus NRRL 1555(-)]OAD73709.1 hypothetical protein PHYBLDRAFT_77798 [Phycomyces blakesleeanus NRRL 1555(-)]|eukprot:XP_018291749.1 hypothetical protein PHYBLDRAFT_77798 [Phycomyces blakesleeanus NRRL 1555(-)]
MLKSPLWLLIFFLTLVLADQKAKAPLPPPTKLLGGTIRAAPNCDRKIGANARITVHYKASVWGVKELFENTYKKEPIVYRLGRDKMLKGLEQGIEGMCVGEIRRLLIPADLAYGELGVPGVVPPNSALVYEVELIDSLPPWKNPWFWIGIAGFASAYYIVDKKTKGKDEIKASKFLESKLAAGKEGVAVDNVAAATVTEGEKEDSAPVKEKST